jgi:dihydroorotate dehydrogenase electron transfer subunit
LSGWHTEANEIRILKIRASKTESPKVKTFYFGDELCSSAKPGQFVMVWIPGVDEIPLSLSSTEDKLSSVIVKEVGEATRALCKMDKGDTIGVRGPFGNHFEITGKEALVVGGGTGTAPLMMLTTKLLNANVKTTIIEGAKTRGELLFFDQLAKLGAEPDVEVLFTTDDGSYGFRGFATDAAEKMLSSRKFDVIYCCGNEAMTRKVYLLARKQKTHLQASLERIMLCAMGICGSCVIGKYRVCKDGPVFDQAQLEEVEDELGRFKRDFKGEKVIID